MGRIRLKWLLAVYRREYIKGFYCLDCKREIAANGLGIKKRRIK